MDCGGISEEEFQYMLHWLKHEGLTSVLNYLKEKRIDLRNHPVEFTTYEILPKGGVYYNEKAETSVKGLYAAGDEMQGAAISGSAIMGWIAGENAARYAKEEGLFLGNQVKAKAEEKESFIEEV